MKFLTITDQEWDKLYSQTDSQNLLQCAEYLKTIEQANGSTFVLYSIRHNENTIGIFSIVKHQALKGVVQTVMLDRGPLWLKGHGTSEELKVFFNEFNQRFPARFLTWRRIIPELRYNQENKALLQSCGFNQRKLGSYSTIIVDLFRNIEELRADLRGNWRNQLMKAEKDEIKCEWHLQGEYLGWLLSKYIKDKRKKAYKGPSESFMRSLSKNFAEKGNLIIGFARFKGQILAANLVLCHGNTATYQLGWVDLDGRKKCANNLLLWETMIFLKNRNIKHFDLGGVNSLDAKNIRWYKAGMGGHEYELVGTYA